MSGSATVAPMQPPVQRIMQPPKPDKLLTSLQNSGSEDGLIQGLAPLRYPIPVKALANIIAQAYAQCATQPAYSILQNKPGVWTVDQMPGPGERVPASQFLSNVRCSTRLKALMYHKALYANVRMVVAAIMGKVLKEYVDRSKKNMENAEVTGVTGTPIVEDVFLSMATDAGLWKGNSITLEWAGGSQQAKLDNGGGIHLTVWARCRGNSWTEVDVCAMGEAFAEERNEAASGDSRLPVNVAFSQGTVAMKRIGQPKLIETILSTVSEKVQEYNAEKKKEKQKERRRRRNKNKKKDKK